MRSLVCLLAFGVLYLTTVCAAETVSPDQALEILDSLADNPDLLRGRHLLQSGPLSHQLAVCRADALKGILCPIIAHYLAVCRKKFGVHTLKCTATTATACVSKAYSVSSTGKCVCSKGYEHYYGVCIACPAGKVKNVVSYGQCVTCALGKYQPARGQARCLKCNIITHRVNAPIRSSCTLRSNVTPAPNPTPTPKKSPTPTKTPTKPTAAPTTKSPPPTVKSPPPSPVVLSPPSPAAMPPPNPAPMTG